jgi:hypothetical protein
MSVATPNGGVLYAKATLDPHQKGDRAVLDRRWVKCVRISNVATPRGGAVYAKATLDPH